MKLVTLSVSGAWMCNVMQFKIVLCSYDNPVSQAHFLLFGWEKGPVLLHSLILSARFPDYGDVDWCGWG